MSTLLETPTPADRTEDPVDRGRTPAPHDVVAALTTTTTRRPWIVVAAALVLVAASVAGLGLGMRTVSSDEQAVGESAAAQDLIEAADFGQGPTETIVITAADGGQLDPVAVEGLTADLRREVAAEAAVAGLGEAVLSPDGTTAILPVALAAEANDDIGTVEGAEALNGIRESVATGWPELTVGQVGQGSLDSEVGEALEGDFRRAELLALPATLIVLLIAFGAGVAALVPVAVGMASVVTAMGVTALVSQFFPVDQNAQSLILLIGLAVGVDYALFVLRRTREERAAGLAPRAAVAATGRTAVRAVVVSGVTVVIAMIGLVVAGGMFTSLGIGTAVVVAVSVVASMTLLPALLALLGDRMEALRMPWRRRSRQRVLAADDTSGAWGRLASAVVRRPLIWGGAAVLALLALAAPALGMRTALGGVETLPAGFQTVQAYEAMAAAFPEEGETVDVVVSAAAEDAPAVSAALGAAHSDALAVGAATGEPAIQRSVDGATHILHLGAPGSLSSAEAERALDDVRRIVVPDLEASLVASGVDGAEVAVGGDIAFTNDFTTWLDGRLPIVIGFVLVLTLVVMALSFGSLSLAAATVGLNLLSVAAAYGILTLVFQGTWAESLLGFTSTGSIASWLPLMLFVVLFGLSMDYHVFVVSRVREARLAGADARRAAVVGIARSAGVVTSAAAVMIAVFAIFGTLSVLEMKQMGVGLAAAVLLDATVVRGFLLPATLALLGDRAHRGPRWLPALHG